VASRSLIPIGAAQDSHLLNFEYQTLRPTMFFSKEVALFPASINDFEGAFREAFGREMTANEREYFGLSILANEAAIAR
jgi:hypothetical protein